MRLLMATTVAERAAEALRGATVLRPLYDGRRSYYVPVVLADGRRFEIRSAADLKRVAPKGRRASRSRV